MPKNLEHRAEEIYLAAFPQGIWERCYPQTKEMYIRIAKHVQSLLIEARSDEAEFCLNANNQMRLERIVQIQKEKELL